MGGALGVGLEDLRRPRREEERKACGTVEEEEEEVVVEGGRIGESPLPVDGNGMMWSGDTTR
jgi:hypothetical protein